MFLVVVGLGLGLCGAAALSRVLSGLLFEVSGLDPVTFGAVALGLAGVAAVASYLPTRRVIRLDPMKALRSVD
jgi:ABC-type antimicrobial peptide transport system permease subunit